jgi:hypothetical protein
MKTVYRAPNLGYYVYLNTLKVVERVEQVHFQSADHGQSSVTQGSVLTQVVTDLRPRKLDKT